MTLAFRPARADLATVGILVSRAVLVVSAAMLVPAALGLVVGEVDSALALVFGSCSGLATAAVAERTPPPPRDVGRGWWPRARRGSSPRCPALSRCTCPCHFGSFPQAYFEAMSGLTCTGLCVLHELDHLSGVRVSSAVFHAVNPFFAAFDTGGFSPRSTSVGYYHSAPVEAVLIVLMIAGALSFALHHRLWQGDGRELLRNIETRVLAITFTTFFAMLVVGLVGNGVYRDGVTAFRRVPVGQRTHGGGVLLHPWCGLLDRVGVLNTRRRRTRA